jgi:hypothetical protein
MPTQDFEKTNWGWQFYLFQKQAGEWLDSQLSGFQNAIPNLPPGWRISQWFLDALTILFWILVGLFSLWLIWRLWKEFNPYLFAWLNEKQNPSNANVRVTQKELSSSVLLARSHEYYRQQNYREACRYLYLTLIQLLHEKSILPSKLSRTDGEYLELLKLSSTSMPPYETLITTHEQICFDDMQVVQENYEQCRQAYREIAQE